MHTFFWWISKLFIGLVSLFFFVRGINVLIYSYTLTNPLEFIMYFFSSSMLILISLVGIIYCFFKVLRRVKGEAVR